MADRPGLYLCCMRRAERAHEAGADGTGTVIQCDKCQQYVIKSPEGGWRVATESEVRAWKEEE